MQHNSSTSLEKLCGAAQRIGSLVKVSRLTARQLFDELVAERQLSTPTSFLHAVIAGQMRLRNANLAEMDPAVDREAIGLALLALGGTTEIAALMSSAISLGLFDSGDEATRSREREAAWTEIRTLLELDAGNPVPEGGAASAFPQRGVSGAPQAVTDVNGTWTNPDVLHPAIMRALRRMCKIKVAVGNGRPITGSGLLVGPNAVLTNWHVVSDLPRPLGSQNQLTISFPISRSGHPSRRSHDNHYADEEWLIAHSEMGHLQPVAPLVNSVDGEIPWWEDEGSRRTWAAGLAGNLDFAIIRIKDPLGLDRGFYDLSKLRGSDDIEELEEVLGGSCHAFHYPGNQSLCFSSGSFRYAGSTRPNRVFHNANTTPGSSGGLLLDHNGEPVALHHAGYGLTGNVGDVLTNTAGEPIAINGAIPLATIFKSLPPEKFDEIRRPSQRALVNGCLVDQRPVFGRNGLIKAVDAIASGREKRFLQIDFVEGLPKRPGKTFSVDILMALFPSPKDTFVRLTPEQLKEEGIATARLILAEAVPGKVMPHPEANTTEAAYYLDHLVPKFADAVAEEFGDRRLWLVLDELDRMDIPASGGRAFLNALYSKITDIPSLRVVFIGLNTQLPSVPVELVALCPLNNDEIGDVTTMVDNWLWRRGLEERGIMPEVSKMLAQLMISASGEDISLESISQFAQRHVTKPLAALLGDA